MFHFLVICVAASLAFLAVWYAAYAVVWLMKAAFRIIDWFIERLFWRPLGWLLDRLLRRPLIWLLKQVVPKQHCGRKRSPAEDARPLVSR